MSQLSPLGRRAVFLDRDGTINHDTHYLSQPREVSLIPGSARAIARLNAAGLAVVVVSNQSGLARGYFGSRELEAVRRELDRQLGKEGARVEAYYHCPHHPRGRVPELAITCECRKPRPGLIMQAARELGLELTGSFMVGDKNTDVACGRAAGLTSIRVLSGPEQPPPRGEEEIPDFVAPDLAGAVEWILRRLGIEA